MRRKFIVLGFMLSFLAFITSGLNAQNDAFFYGNVETRNIDGHNTNGFRGYGFSFDLFDEELGNGFSFDGFANDDDGSFNFGDFDMAADDAPLSGGHLLLLGFALAFLRLKSNLSNLRNLWLRLEVKGISINCFANDL